MTGVEVWGVHSGDLGPGLDDRRRGARGVRACSSSARTRSRDMSVIRTRISGFRSLRHQLRPARLRSPGRRRSTRSRSTTEISDIDDPDAPPTAPHEGGIWSGGVAAAIIGNRIRDTGWDGIQTVGSSRARDRRRQRHRAAPASGSTSSTRPTDSLFARNAIADVVTGINVEWRYDGAGSSGNTFEATRIVRPRRGRCVRRRRGRPQPHRRQRRGRRDRARDRAPGRLRQRRRAATAGCERPGQPVVRLSRARTSTTAVAAHSLRNRARRQPRACRRVRR